MQNFDKQIQFLKEVDKLKEVYRQSYLFSQSRKENSAEHSWHLAMLAIVLLEHSTVQINILRVLKMLLVHDIVEIDAGDTFVYDDSEEVLLAKRQREEQSANRIFGILPEEQSLELRALWEEFESEKTPDAIYAASLDRVMPLLHNIYSDGRSWREHGVKLEQVLAKNSKIATACPEIWKVLEAQILKVFSS